LVEKRKKITFLMEQLALKEQPQTVLNLVLLKISFLLNPKLNVEFVKII